MALHTFVAGDVLEAQQLNDSFAAVGGIRYITGAAFSAVTSVSLPNNTFSSTYRNYRIILSITTSASGTASTMRLRAAGTDETSNAYRYAMRGLTATNVAFDANSNASTSWLITSSNNDLPSSMVIDVIEPQIAVDTQVSGLFVGSDATYNQYTRAFGGNINLATQYDSMSFLFAANMSGTYRVYGYADS